MFITTDSVVKSLELDNDDLLDNEFDKKPFFDELLNDFNDFYKKYKKLTLKN